MEADPGLGPTILVCGWQGELVRSFVHLGARVVALVDRANREPARGDSRLSLCDRVFFISSFDSLEEVGAIAAELLTTGVRITQVVSPKEVSQHCAGYLEALLGVAADPLYRLRLRDKRLMKSTLAAAGIRVARFASVPSPEDTDALAAATRRLRPPYVLKPAAGYGTMSTYECATATDLLDIADTLRLDPQIRSRQLIVEEFVPGEELQIEMFWSAGVLVHLVVFKYHRQRIRMMPLQRSHRDGVRLVLPEEDPDAYAAIETMATRAARAFGITEGTSQIEAFLDADGTLTLSEIAARGGGAWTPALMKEYLGHPLWDLIARCHLDVPVTPPHRTHRYLASISIRPDEPGRVTAFPSREDYEALPGVLSWDRVRNVGDRARLHHPSDYYVHVIVGADTLPELDERCARAQAELFVQVDDLTSTPALVPATEPSHG